VSAEVIHIFKLHISNGYFAIDAL